MILQLIQKCHRDFGIEQELIIGHEIAPPILETPTRPQAVILVHLKVWRVILTHNEKTSLAKVLELGDSSVEMYKGRPMWNALVLDSVAKPSDDALKHERHEIAVTNQQGRFSLLRTCCWLLLLIML